MCRVKIQVILFLTVICAAASTHAGSAFPLDKGAPEGEGACGEDLTIMSFNIRFLNLSDGENGWGTRKALVEDVIARYDPDLVGMQEALLFQWFPMLDVLTQYESLGVGRDDGDITGEYANIYYRKDRFEVLESNTFWFSTTPDVPGSTSWGAGSIRICTWARFRDMETGTAFYLANMHLDNSSSLSRSNSVDLLLERIADWTDPVYLTGDFNMGEGTSPIVRLKEDGPFIDTFRVVRPDATAVRTFHSFTGAIAGSKIDYVFARPGTAVSSADIIRDDYDGSYPSDHYPVIATVTLPCIAGEGEGEGEGKGEGEGEAAAEGEGAAEGGSEGEGEGEAAAEGEGAAEGGSEGEGEAGAEGEGAAEGGSEGEGEGCPVDSFHTADQDSSNSIELTELLRIVQFYNSDGFGCQMGTEDGYAPGSLDQDCCPHDSDYSIDDPWTLGLPEVLRAIQIFNSGGYTYCPGNGTEDGFCPDTA
jgi:endonuclease/exonuclease/phosphatase family metal-dependent hydrolase